MENNPNQTNNLDQDMGSEQGFGKKPTDAGNSTQTPSDTGQAGYGNSGQSATQSPSFDQGQSDTEIKQRSDMEGQSSTGQTGQQSTASTGQATDTGFVGSEGQTDTSSELVEDDDPDFAKDGQGSIE